MYLQIEEEFKEQSKLRTSQLFFCLGIILMISIALLLLSNYIEQENWYFYSILFGSITGICLLVACYMVMFFISFPTKTRSLKQFFKINDTIQTYNEKMHNDDIKILKDILKEYNINTRPKVQEAIRHYQCLLPRKIISSDQLLTFLPLVISLVALLFSEPFLYSESNINILLFLLIVITLIYLFIEFIAKYILKIFGKDALYTRLEASLSEIFMNYYSLKKEEAQENEDDS